MTDPEGTRVGLGALLVGVLRWPAPRLCGRVGTGFSHAFAIELRERLDALGQKPCPFDPPIVKGPNASRTG